MIWHLMVCGWHYGNTYERCVERPWEVGADDTAIRGVKESSHAGPISPEAMFKRAIDVEPTRASTLGNYALFLKTQRKDYDAAEAMFKRAIEADPNHTNNICNYAKFLADQRKDYDAARTILKRAIVAAPSNEHLLDTFVQVAP